MHVCTYTGGSSVPLLPETKGTYPTQLPPEEESQLVFYFSLVENKALSLPPLPGAERESAAAGGARGTARSAGVCTRLTLPRHPREEQLRRQVRGCTWCPGLVPLEGTPGSSGRGAAEGPAAEEALGQLLLGLLEAGPGPSVQ